MIGATVYRLRRDVTAAAMIEFAMLAPLLIAMVLGVFQIGLHANNYSSVRSVLSDAGRYAAVEYQRENGLTLDELRAAIYSRATAPPYNLAGNRLDVQVTELTSEIGDARKFDIALAYAPPNFLGMIGIDQLTIAYSRPVYVRKIAVVP